MKFKFLLLAFTGLLLQMSVSAQEGWTLKKDKNGIKVFSRKSSIYKFDQLKVECEFEGRMSQLAAVLLDVNNQSQWVYKTHKSQLIKENSSSEVFYYTEIDCPWPFENRDMVIHMSIAQNTENKVMTIIAKSINDYLEDKPNLVRIKYSSALWTVTPIDKDHFKIEYTIQVDPGNGIPAWLLNLFATNGPYESFLNLKKKIKLPQYAQVKFPFILE